VLGLGFLSFFDDFFYLHGIDDYFGYSPIFFATPDFFSHVGFTIWDLFFGSVDYSTE
jgi:hypothetical protein